MSVIYIRNKDGALVPISSNNTIKTVNGVGPDENGNIEIAIPDSGGNVAYDEEQNLTDEQKAQARENIGAQPAGNYLTEVPEGYAKTEDVPTDAEIIQLIKNNAPESSGGGIAVTGAKVGQTVKISAVDENGAPTAWMPTDFPSGAGEEWELINSVEIEEEVNKMIFNVDSNGEEFVLRKALFVESLAPYTGTETVAGYMTGMRNNKAANIYTSAPAASTTKRSNMAWFVEASCDFVIEEWVTSTNANNMKAQGKSERVVRMDTKLNDYTQSIGVNGSIIPVGSIFKLYGVRA